MKRLPHSAWQRATRGSRSETLSRKGRGFGSGAGATLDIKLYHEQENDDLMSCPTMADDKETENFKLKLQKDWLRIARRCGYRSTRHYRLGNRSATPVTVIQAGAC